MLATSRYFKARAVTRVEQRFILALFSIALISLAYLSPASATPQSGDNGEVFIGRFVEGPDLIRSNVPSEPLLVAVDSPYEVFNESGTLIHVAAWTADGQPARGANVYFRDHLLGQADDTGTLVFRWGASGETSGVWNRAGRVSVRWEQGSTLYGGEVSFSANSRTSSFASDHLFVYTDRGVYNPGDTVRIRVLAWHLSDDYSPLDGESVEFLLTDPSERVVAGATAETNEFGVTALEFPLSSQAEEGVYELTANYEDSTSTARLRIKRFTPPVINIQHTLGRFITRDQRDLSFDVTLGYFTEAEFDGGNISLDVLVEGESRYHTSLDVTGPGPHGITIDQTALDAVRSGLLEDDRIEVELVVTDVYGRRDELTRELRYTSNPYVAIIEKDRDEYSAGDAIELMVRLTDKERVPIRQTEVTLVTSTGRSLTVETDDGGIAQFSLTMPSTAFQVEVLVADVASAIASAQIPIQGSQPMRSHIGDAVVREDEPAHVSVSFPSHYIPAESVVHMDVVDTSGALVQSVLIPVRAEDGVYVAEASFTAPSWGSMLLTFFCLGRDISGSGSVPRGHSAFGLFTEGQNLAVHPGRELQIHLDGIPDDVAPGDAYSAQIRVSDASGNPVDAVVGAAVVDMAVISLKSPLEITPMDYFYNPQLRVISTTGSAILTWPVVSRNWGGRRRDVALPPFPFLESGRVEGVFDGERKVEFAFGDDEIDPDDAALLAMGPGGLNASPMYVDAYSMVGDYAFEVADAEVAQAAPVITIRTEFPDTSLWDPYIEVVDGRGELAGQMPDAITTQEIALVASDRNGGVGVLRVPVLVSQPLFVQADLPDDLTVGDQLDARVAVQNLTDEAQTVEVSLSAHGLEVEGGRQTVQVEAEGTAVATFPIRARQPGPIQVVVSARSDERQDIEERTVWVRPAGVPELNQQVRTLTADEPVELAVSTPEGGQMTTLTLNVAFPAISAAFGGLEAIQYKLAAGDTMSMGGEIIAQALLYDYRKQRGEDPVRLASMRVELQRGLADILAAQRSDGGWGFCWDWESNPYISAYVLEALTALDQAGVPASTDAFRNAVNWLAEEGSRGLYDMSAIAFWEGNTETVRLGLTAEIFSILAGVPSRARTPEWRLAIEAMGPRFEAYLNTSSPDVLTYAHAILGLHRSTEASVIDVDSDQLARAARRLNRLRDEAHWEPSWFNAYGGTVEATLAALQVFQALETDGLSEAEQRQAVRYLLSTRDEWGGWHNPRGTAAAIRAMLILQPPSEERPAEVVVQVDELEVARVAIDPADPFLSSNELRALDLSEYLGSGETQVVSVSYDGSLAPDVNLMLRHWPEAERVEGRLVRLDSELSADEIAVDGVASYTLHVTSNTAEPRLIRVDVAPPANAEIDSSSVESLRERGLIDGFERNRTGYQLTLQLDSYARRELDFVLVAVRPGRSTVPVALATVVGAQDVRDGTAVALLNEPLTVH